MRLLTPTDEERLLQLLVAAFPTRAELEQLVRFALGVSLEQIEFGDNLRDVVFKLIEHATSRGELERVVVKALEQRPRDAALAAWALSVGVASPPPPPAGATGWSLARWPRRRVALVAAGAVALVAAGGAGLFAWSRYNRRYYVRCEPADARIVRTEIDGVAGPLCNVYARLRPGVPLRVDADGYEPFRGSREQLACDGSAHCVIQLRPARWSYSSVSAPQRSDLGGGLCGADGGAASETVVWAVRVRPPGTLREPATFSATVRPEANDGLHVVQLHPIASDCGAAQAGGVSAVRVPPACAAVDGTLALFVRACRRTGEGLNGVVRLRVSTGGGNGRPITVEFASGPADEARGVVRRDNPGGL